MFRFFITVFVAALLSGCGKAPGPSGSEAAIAYGQQALAKGSYEAAIGWFSSALESDPNSAAAYRLRAEAYYMMAETMAALPKEGYGAERAADTPVTQLEKAIADATKATDLDPRDAAAYLVRAKAQHRKGGAGTKDKAVADCDKALELAADGPVAAEAKKLREQIRGG